MKRLTVTGIVLLFTAMSLRAQIIEERQQPEAPLPDKPYNIRPSKIKIVNAPRTIADDHPLQPLYF